MKGPEKRPVVKLLGSDGNAFYILAKVKEGLKKAGADQEYIKKYFDEATLGDYDNLLVVSMKYADIE